MLSLVDTSPNLFAFIFDLPRVFDVHYFSAFVQRFFFFINAHLPCLLIAKKELIKQFLIEVVLFY